MTHCAGYRAAAVARSRQLGGIGIGIDAEPHAELPDDVLDLVLRDEERAHLDVLADRSPDPHWGRILFCAREAVFKASFPLTRRWLEFSDVSMSLRVDGMFEARLCLSGTLVAGGPNYFAGRWIVARGLVVAATTCRATTRSAS